jgi:aryl-alcohol dehydrogenase-like predicted oxidoreductase
VETRTLGQTGLQTTVLGFGASSLGAEFRSVDLNEAIRTVGVALECGMNLIDTSPYYGRGQSEVLLGYALQDVPRDSYILCSKLGRYAPSHFDFSARRVVESIDISLERMKTDHLDIALCHDIEFVSLDRIVEETIPALERVRDAGKVRWIGVSGYPMKMFDYITARSRIDVVLSYNHYTLQNTMLESLVPTLNARGVGIMNAAPFSARLLSGASLPVWHKAPQHVRQVASDAAEHCRKAGSDIAKLAVQFSVANPAFATCIAGSANPDRVRQWCHWIEEPIDEELLSEILMILKPIHNWFYVEGLPENNDSVRE